MIYIAADHGGFSLKQKIIEYFKNKTGLDIEDLGAYEHNPHDDYPDFVIPAIEKLSKNPGSLGIVICKNGVGVSILANKFRDVRAALSWTPKQAESSRADDDSNVLALPASYISDKEAIEIVDIWLKTKFSSDERHLRRLEKIRSVYDCTNHS